jgi:hypothetical protein
MSGSSREQERSLRGRSRRSKLTASVEADEQRLYAMRPGHDAAHHEFLRLREA